jgi:hypothetical protein
VNHRKFEVLSALCLALGVVAWVWQLFALQPPTSPWHIQGMPNALERLATQSLFLGIACSVFTRNVTLPRWIFVCTVVGAFLWLGAQTVSAATGLLGVQVHDWRSGSTVVLIARVLGGSVLCVALATVWVKRYQSQLNG